MILDSEISINAFKEAVEEYWWPRLISDQLDVELWDKDGNPSPSPEPQLNPALKPYIRSYALIEDDIPPLENERTHRLNNVGDYQTGKLGLVPLPPIDLDVDDDPTHDTHFRNTVALVRSGPKMVVEYLNTGGRQRGNFAGTFVGHPNSETALHLSEPPAHNAWNPNSERLRKADPSYPALVKSILNRVKTQTRRFQKELSPTPPSEPVAGTRKLEQMLAKVMSGAGFGQGNPILPRPDPFQVRIQEGRTNKDGISTVTAKVEIGLRGDSAVDEADIFMHIRPTVCLDDNLRREASERLKLKSATVDGSEVKLEGESGIPARISKGTIVTIIAESEPFDRDMYAELEVSVRTVSDSTTEVVK